MAACGVDGFAEVVRELPEDCDRALGQLLAQVSLADWALLDCLWKMRR
jgi:hypothetical protein